MNIELKRPLVFFDLETTGLDVATDRIVSIAINKLMPDSSIERKYALINPTIPIPKEASAINGLTDEMVKDKPTFKQLSVGIHEFMKDCDLVGYNNNYYDNALLQEEFFRVGIEYPNTDVKSIDCCFIFKHFEKRDLATALKHYCSETMQNAHTSQADTDATQKIFFAQIEKYPELKGKTIDELSAFCNPENRVDWQGKIVVDAKGDYLYNFGKERGKRVRDNIGFAEWILKNNFSATTKILIKNIMDKINNQTRLKV